MILVKGARVEDMHKEMWPMAVRLDLWWRKYFGYELHITSGKNGKHSKASDHNWGGGLDLRTWTTAISGEQTSSTKRRELLNRLKRFLGKHWFVLDEGTHFHISYRPQDTNQ